MDYLVAALKKRGIYVKLAAHFGAQKLGPADKRHVPYLAEFGEFDGNESRITTPHSAVHYAPELQQVQILQMVNLLQHKNPYTGLTYAEDPAIAFLEIINEQSILFYSSPVPLRTSPTLSRHVARRFCQWLREKYGTQERLSEAWGGKQAFDGFTSEGFPAVGERLDRDNILPIGNPWFWDPAQLSGSQAYRKQRLLDTMWFLYGLQNEFYARYVAAVRGPATRARSFRQTGKRAGPSAISATSIPTPWWGRSTGTTILAAAAATDRQRHDAGGAGFGNAQRRDAAGGRPAVHALRMDSRYAQ